MHNLYHLIIRKDSKRSIEKLLVQTLELVDWLIVFETIVTRSMVLIPFSGCHTCKIRWFVSRTLIAKRVLVRTDSAEITIPRLIIQYSTDLCCA